MEYRTLRTVLLSMLGGSGMMPTLHGVFIFEWENLFRPFVGLIVFFLMLLVGVIFYATRFPECCYPGRFDYYLSSHQLWHLFVFMAVVFHYENTLHIFSTIPLRDCVPWPAL